MVLCSIPGAGTAAVDGDLSRFHAFWCEMALCSIPGAGTAAVDGDLSKFHAMN